MRKTQKTSTNILKDDISYIYCAPENATTKLEELDLNIGTYLSNFLIANLDHGVDGCCWVIQCIFPPPKHISRAPSIITTWISNMSQGHRKYIKSMKCTRSADQNIKKYMEGIISSQIYVSANMNRKCKGLRKNKLEGYILHNQQTLNRGHLGLLYHTFHPQRMEQ